MQREIASLFPLEQPPVLSLRIGNCHLTFAIRKITSHTLVTGHIH